MSLCMWTRAMDVYNRVAKVVEPKRQKLRQAQQQLEAANAALAAKQEALRGVVARVEGLRRQLAEAQAEQKRLNEQVGFEGPLAARLAACENDEIRSAPQLALQHPLINQRNTNTNPTPPGRPHPQAPRARRQAHLRPGRRRGALGRHRRLHRNRHPAARRRRLPGGRLHRVPGRLHGGVQGRAAAALGGGLPGAGHPCQRRLHLAGHAGDACGGSLVYFWHAV